MYKYSNLTYVSTLLPDSILTTAEFSVKELYIYTTKYTNLWHTLLVTGTAAMLLVAVCTG